MHHKVLDLVHATRDTPAQVIRVQDSRTAGATEQGWAEVLDADGSTGYLRIYAAK